MTELVLRPLEQVPDMELSALAREAFADEQPSDMLAQVLADEKAARVGLPTVTDKDPYGLAAYRGTKLVGWTQGYRVGTHQFYMLNSGVLTSERRTGVYTQLVLAVLAHAKAQAYTSVKSLHVATNSPVIIAKLRLGFYIAGFEYSEVYGPLVQLKYLVTESRRGLYKDRTASIRAPGSA